MPVVNGVYVFDADEEAAARADARADGTLVAPTQADNRRAKAAAKAKEQPLHDAYGAGVKAGKTPAGSTRVVSSSTRRVGPGKGGASTGVARILAPAGGGPAVRPVRSAAGLAGSGAGVFVGAIAWALVSAYLDYGPTGPRAWLAAKFLNRKGNAPGLAAQAAAALASGVPGTPAGPQTPVPAGTGGLVAIAKGDTGNIAAHIPVPVIPNRKL